MNVHLDRERYNGFQDEDGCPDYPDFITSLDSDFDGIIDSVDECPLVPETYNMFEDLKTVVLIL